MSFIRDWISRQANVHAELEKKPWGKYVNVGPDDRWDFVDTPNGRYDDWETHLKDGKVLAPVVKEEFDREGYERAERMLNEIYETAGEHNINLGRNTYVDTDQFVSRVPCEDEAFEYDLEDCDFVRVEGGFRVTTQEPGSKRE